MAKNLKLTLIGSTEDFAEMKAALEARRSQLHEEWRSARDDQVTKVADELATKVGHLSDMLAQL